MREAYHLAGAEQRATGAGHEQHAVGRTAGGDREVVVAVPPLARHPRLVRRDPPGTGHRQVGQRAGADRRGGARRRRGDATDVRRCSPPPVLACRARAGIEHHGPAAAERLGRQLGQPFQRPRRVGGDRVDDAEVAHGLGGAGMRAQRLDADVGHGLAGGDEHLGHPVVRAARRRGRPRRCRAGRVRRRRGSRCRLPRHRARWRRHPATRAGPGGPDEGDTCACSRGASAACDAGCGRVARRPFRRARGP